MARMPTPTGRSGDPFRDRRTFAFRNDGATTVPPFGVVMVSGMDWATGIVTVTEPNLDEVDPSMLAFNVDTEVAVGAEGRATFEGPHLAAVVGVPVVGDGLGTQADQWTLGLNLRGFRAWSTVTAGVCLVVNRYRALVGVACVNGQLTGDYLEGGGSGVPTGPDDMKPVINSLDFRWRENNMYAPFIQGF